MRGYHFYAEMPECRKSKSASKAHPIAFTRKGLETMLDNGMVHNVVAVMPDQWTFGSDGALYDAFGSVQDIPNGPVCGSNVSDGYLRTRCVRVSEELARKLHPALFKRIDE